MPPILCVPGCIRDHPEVGGGGGQLCGDDGHGERVSGPEQALPEAAVHRQKRLEDRNATAVIDRAIQTLKKDLAGRAVRDGEAGGTTWSR